MRGKELLSLPLEDLRKTSVSFGLVLKSNISLTYLTQMAYDVLWMPASSVFHEQAFSKSGNPINENVID